MVSGRFAHLKPLPKPLASRTLTRRVDHFPGELRLQLKRTPRLASGDMLGLEPQPEQISHDRDSHRAFPARDLCGDLMWPEADDTFEFLHQSFHPPPAEIDGHNSGFAIKYPWECLDCTGFSPLTMSKPVTFELGSDAWPAAPIATRLPSAKGLRYQGRPGLPGAPAGDPEDREDLHAYDGDNLAAGRLPGKPPVYCTCSGAMAGGECNCLDVKPGDSADDDEPERKE
jgi:hypothetical protein